MRDALFGFHSFPAVDDEEFAFLLAVRVFSNYANNVRNEECAVNNIPIVGKSAVIISIN